MSGNYLVVFDAGTGGGRCTVFDATGRQLISEYREWRYRQPKVAPDAREFSPDQFSLCWRMRVAALGQS